MADEVLRLRILAALQKSLAQISVTNGYVFDLDEVVTLEGENGPEDHYHRVKTGRAIFGDKDPLPMLSILEVPIPLDQVVPPEDSSYSNGGWALLIQGFVKDDLINPTRPAHRLMADVKKRLAWEKRRNRDFDILGMGENHITDMRIGAGVVRPPDEISAKAYFWLDLTLDITEDLSNPYED